MTLYKYEIYYRLDESEYYNTSSTEIEGDSIEEIFDQIKLIEKRSTVIFITNLSLV